MQDQTPVTEQNPHETNKFLHAVFGWLFREVEKWKLIPEEFMFRSEALDVVAVYMAQFKREIESHRHPNRTFPESTLAIRLSNPELAKELETQHGRNKIFRNSLAWVHYKLQHMPCEYSKQQHTMEAMGALFNICTQLQAEIEKVEPPAPKEENKPSGPYVIDVPQQEAVQ